MTPGDVFPGNGKLTSQEEEIRQLRHEVEVPKQEREILSPELGEWVDLEAAEVKPQPEAIVLGNTVYSERAVNAPRAQGHSVEGKLLQYLAPLGWAHINLTGDYAWKPHRSVESGQFRALPPLASAQRRILSVS